jgi:hypothetical protein
LIYLAYLQSIPADIYQSATVDGATPRRAEIAADIPTAIDCAAEIESVDGGSASKAYEPK